MIYGSWPKKGIDYGQLAGKVYFCTSIIAKARTSGAFWKGTLYKYNFLWNHNQR
jgi:hypothetical protein